MSRAAAGIAFVLVAVLGVLVGLLSAGGGVVSGPAPAAAPPPALTTPSFADIVQRVNPAVVNVSVVDKARLDPVAGDSEGQGVDVPRRGEGSGFLVDPEGFILTNHHLVGGAQRIRVRFADRSERPARLVGSDPSTDVALIKIEGAGLPTVPLGRSDRLRVGDWVCAIGNPYSFDHTVTAGVVSSLGRKIFDASFDAYIQTDAAINPGNSGGPLINAAGEAVGISTAVSTEGQGIGFAVPIDLARDVMEQLRTRGRVARGYLGVQLEEVDPDLQRLLGLREPKGAMVLDVVPGRAGERAGLRRYDVITALSGQPIEDGDELVRAVAGKQPGSVVNLSVVRDGRELSLRAELLDRGADEGGERAGTQDASVEASAGDALGLDVAELNARQKRRISALGRTGVLVRDVLGAQPGLEALSHGDVILELNRRATPDVGSYRAAVAALKPGEPAFLVVHRRGTTFLAKLVAEGR
ncbi:MAG TPA: trypsin-like peptidase domain-containing protein [Vicinamibacteria bacterium]|nr:trypsin-like peptidase domain-containing protein [Vicinamibacteria bacterium]